MRKTIADFEMYEVDTDGNVYRRAQYNRCKKHNPTGILKPIFNSRYYCVYLRKDGKTHRLNIHRLILKAFVGECPKDMESLHEDGDPSNNKLSNLSWGTHKENMFDIWRHGKYYHTVGSKSGTAKLNEEEVLEIRSKSANGVLYKQLAKEYGVQRNTISRIVTRARWKHI